MSIDTRANRLFVSRVQNLKKNKTFLLKTFFAKNPPRYTIDFTLPLSNPIFTP